MSILLGTGMRMGLEKDLGHRKRDWMQVGEAQPAAALTPSGALCSPFKPHFQAAHSQEDENRFV